MRKHFNTFIFWLQTFLKLIMKQIFLDNYSVFYDRMTVRRNRFHPTPGSKRSQLHKVYQSWRTAKNSWWWTERLPGTCRVVIPIKLEFSASFGFIHKELFCFSIISWNRIESQSVQDKFQPPVAMLELLTVFQFVAISQGFYFHHWPWSSRKEAQ